MHSFSDSRINLVEWLGELGYSTRIDLGCEGLILVEGPSEILFFQELLRMVNKDHKFTLMQVGGSSMINSGAMVQLQELIRLVPPEKVKVFVDSERASAASSPPPERTVFVELCKAVGIQAQLSDRRATENYLADSAIKKTLGRNYQALAEFQLLKDVTNSWKKTDSWKIARNMIVADLDGTDLGRFLAGL